MEINEERAKLLLAVFSSYEHANEYFGLDSHDKRVIGEIAEAIFDLYPDLRDSDWDEFLRCSKICKFGRPLTNQEASSLRMIER